MLKFAANLSMMFTEVTMLERFAAAKASGFTGVEFLFPYEFQPDELAGRLHDNGLIQALFNLPPGDWSAGERGIAALPGRENEFRDSVEVALSYAEALGCKTLHVMAGVTPEGTTHAQMFDTLVENLMLAADSFAQAGITAVLEPLNSQDVPGYFLSRAADAALVIESVKRDNVRLQFDFYHAQIMGGDLARTYESHADLVGHIQIAGVPDRHEPDIGEINYPYIFNLINRLGYKDWIGCEYKPRTTTASGLSWLHSLTLDHDGIHET